METDWWILFVLLILIDKQIFKALMMEYRAVFADPFITNGNRWWRPGPAGCYISWLAVTAGVSPVWIPNSRSEIRTQSNINYCRIKNRHGDWKFTKEKKNFILIRFNIIATGVSEILEHKKTNAREVGSDNCATAIFGNSLVRDN